jgi:hypothetical protein
LKSLNVHCHNPQKIGDRLRLSSHIVRSKTQQFALIAWRPQIQILPPQPIKNRLPRAVFTLLEGLIFYAESDQKLQADVNLMFIGMFAGYESSAIIAYGCSIDMIMLVQNDMI